jgi:hypothetical protein
MELLPRRLQVITVWGGHPPKVIVRGVVHSKDSFQGQNQINPEIV